MAATTTPPKVKPTSQKPKPPTFQPQKQTDDGNGGQVGMIIGILLAVIAVIALAAVGAYVMRGKLNLPFGGAGKSDLPTSFDNAVYNPKANETIDIPSPGSISFESPVDTSGTGFNNPTYVEPSLNNPGSDC